MCGLYFAMGMCVCVLCYVMLYGAIRLRSYVSKPSREALHVKMLLRIGTPEATGPFPGPQVNVRAGAGHGNERLCGMLWCVKKDL